MPYYIATVWTVSTDGNERTYTRQVHRLEAPSEQGFRVRAQQHDANDDFVVGPVGLSKDQTTYERDYSNARMSVSSVVSRVF